MFYNYYNYWLKIKKWNIQNKKWFWGGIGGVIITLIITVFIKIYSGSSNFISEKMLISGDSFISGSGNITIHRTIIHSDSFNEIPNSHVQEREKKDEMQLNKPATSSNDSITSQSNDINNISDDKKYVSLSTNNIKPELPNNLNVLIFNASTDSDAHKIFAREFKREFTNIDIDIHLEWVDKYIMSSSLFLFIGIENEKYAYKLDNWFPMRQQIRDYINSPGGFFGFSHERDLIMFIGEDWKDMINQLRKPDTSR